MRPALSERGIPSIGQLTRRIHVAKEYGGNGGASLGAKEPSLHDGRNLVETRYRHRVTRDIDIHEARVYLK